MTCVVCKTNKPYNFLPRNNDYHGFCNQKTCYEIYHKTKQWSNDWQETQDLQNRRSNGTCECCKKTNLTKRQLSVDLCSKTKWVRGVTCMSCNSNVKNYMNGTNANTPEQHIIDWANKTKNKSMNPIYVELEEYRVSKMGVSSRDKIPANKAKYDKEEKARQSYYTDLATKLLNNVKRRNNNESI